MQEINRNNYYKKIDDEVKFERIKKILNTMDNPDILKNYLNK